MTDRPLTDRATFRSWAQETCRYGDTDRQGHVNNAVFATFCETGRVLFMPPPPDGTEFVIVRLTLDFRAELHWQDIVAIGTGTLRIGNSSFVLGQGLFRGEQCVATSEGVIVLLDSIRRRPVPLPDALKTRLGDSLL